MRVTVRLFARLKDLVGAGELARQVDQAANVATVWSDLVREFPALAPYTSSISGAVNAEYARMDAPVAEGDEVAFLPPVSGGSGKRSAGLQACRQEQCSTSSTPSKRATTTC
jgi:molybdopterin converting factor subunit 1